MADGVRNDEEFSGTKAVEERHRIDEIAASTAGCANMSRLSGPADRPAVQGRPVQPDLPARHARPILCDAPQAVRQTAAVGACGRPRVPRHRGARQAGLSGREGLCAVHRRQRDRRLPSTSCRWKRAACSGIRRCRARRRTTRRKIFTSKIETLAEAAHLRSARRSASAISASPATISRARSTAGPSSTAPPRPSRSRRSRG